MIKVQGKVGWGSKQPVLVGLTSAYLNYVNFTVPCNSVILTTNFMKTIITQKSFGELGWRIWNFSPKRELRELLNHWPHLIQGKNVNQIIEKAMHKSVEAMLIAKHIQHFKLPSSKPVRWRGLVVAKSLKGNFYTSLYTPKAEMWNKLLCCSSMQTAGTKKLEPACVQLKESRLK